MVNGVALTVTGKTTLRANTKLVQGLLGGDTVTLCDELGCLVDALLHLLLVLQLRELAGHHTQDHVLVLGEFLQRLEASSTGSVVLKVVSVDVKFLEQFGGNTVIATLGEVTATNEVATTNVNSNVEIGGALGNGVVVQLDVLGERLIGGVLVQGVLLPAGKHLLVAEVYGGNKMSDKRKMADGQNDLQTRLGSSY